MGDDHDRMVLAWFARQPAGVGAVGAAGGMVDRPTADDLVRRGLLAAVPSRDDAGSATYVLTPEGRRYQEGD